MITICIKTEWGSVTAEVYDDKAPKTAAHFMAYVDEGYYDGGCFYRSARSADNESGKSVKIDVIEGGYYNDYYERCLRLGFDDGSPFDESKSWIGPKPKITLETTNETGVKHVNGALSLGRTSPDSVDDAFFICVGNQPELDFGGGRHTDGLGFPAFGKVINGMDVVEKIHKMKTEGQKIIDDVRISSITRI